VIDSPAEEAPEKTETSDQPNRGKSEWQLPSCTNRFEKNEASERKSTGELEILLEEGLRRLPEAQGPAGLRRISDYCSGDLDPSSWDLLSHSLSLRTLSLPRFKGREIVDFINMSFRTLKGFSSIILKLFVISRSWTNFCFIIFCGSSLFNHLVSDLSGDQLAVNFQAFRLQRSLCGICIYTYVQM